MHEKERAVEREQWRQEQHVKRAEEEKIRKQKAAQALLEAEELKKKKAEEAERKEYMANLHAAAVKTMVREKKENVEHQEKVDIRAATDTAQRDERLLDEDTRRSLNHLDAEKMRRAGQAHLEADRRKKEIEDRSRFEKIDVEKEGREREAEASHQADRMKAEEMITAARREASQKKAQIERKHAADLSTCDEDLQHQLFVIDEETKRLKDEIVRNAGNKKILIARQEERKKHEATQKKENFEKWLKDGE